MKRSILACAVLLCVALFAGPALAQTIFSETFDGCNQGSFSGSVGLTSYTSSSPHGGTCAGGQTIQGGRNQQSVLWYKNLNYSGSTVFGRACWRFPSGFTFDAADPNNAWGYEHKMWIFNANADTTNSRFWINLRGGGSNPNFSIFFANGGIDKQATQRWPTDGAWHCVDVEVQRSASSNGRARLWLDGVKFLDETGVTCGGGGSCLQLGEMQIGAYSNQGSPVTETFYLDDVLIAQSNPGGGSPPPVTVAAPPGVLTTKAELNAFKSIALGGTEPHATRRTEMIDDADDAWTYGTVTGPYTVTTDGGGNKHCTNGSNGEDYLLEGASKALAEATGAILTTNGTAATTLAAAGRTHVLDLTDTTYPTNDYSGNNECILKLGETLPVWIEAAELLAEIGTWNAADTTAFRTWVASVYKLPAWAARSRRNNWGAAGSTAAYLSARYVNGEVTSLVEVSPGPSTITPTAAMAAHIATQLVRVRTLTPLDTACGSTYGIQSHGGIPDELRRGSSGCTANHVVASDSSLTYTGMHVQMLVFQARALERYGSNELYAETLSGGTAALLQAIRFVIENTNGNQTWPANFFGGLYTANGYYTNAALAAAATADTSWRRGSADMPWMLVYALADQASAAPVSPQLISGYWSTAGYHKRW